MWCNHGLCDIFVTGGGQVLRRPVPAGRNGLSNRWHRPSRGVLGRGHCVGSSRSFLARILHYVAGGRCFILVQRPRDPVGALRVPAMSPGGSVRAPRSPTRRGSRSDSAALQVNQVAPGTQPHGSRGRRGCSPLRAGGSAVQPERSAVEPERSRPQPEGSPSQPCRRTGATTWRAGVNEKALCANQNAFHPGQEPFRWTIRETREAPGAEARVSSR